MKKLIFLFVLLVSAVTFRASAQISVNINIGSQPAWGPVGYDYAQYYYMPAIGVYYNVPQRYFVYPMNGRWITASRLPGRYRDYDLYNTYKVVINEPNPWMRHNRYYNRYAGYSNRGSQMVLRDYDGYGGKKVKKIKVKNGRGNGHGHGRY